MTIDIDIRRCETAIFDTMAMRHDIDYRTVDVDMIGRVDGLIHTIEAGPADAQTLVLIHGYGSGAVTWFKLIAKLRSMFHIYAIDLFGMGLSTRKDIKDYKMDDLAELYAESLEGWRRALNLEGFVLMGHSLGGYIASHWVRLKNPPIKLLYLLSPAGFTNKEVEEVRKNKSLFKKAYHKLYDYFVHKRKDNPYDYLPCKDYFLTKKFNKFEYFSDRQIELLGTYQALSLSQKSSGEETLGVFLKYAKYSSYPICEMMSEINQSRGFTYPILMMYGANDFMDYEESAKMLKILNLKIPITFIHRSKHNIMLQNPDELADLLSIHYNQGYDKITLEYFRH